MALGSYVIVLELSMALRTQGSQLLMKNGIKVGNTALTQTAEELAVILVPSATIDLPSGNNGKHCWHSWISQCFYGN
jgi:hypothetical protein